MNLKMSRIDPWDSLSDKTYDRMRRRMANGGPETQIEIDDVGQVASIKE